MAGTTATLYLPPSRPGSAFFKDKDGYWSTWKTEDETIAYSVDWTELLASGETVSSVAYEASGVTTSGAALVTPVSTITVAGTSGTLEITATSSSSRKLQINLRFRDSTPTLRKPDYGR